MSRDNEFHTYITRRISGKFATTTANQKMEIVQVFKKRFYLFT